MRLAALAPLALLGCVAAPAPVTGPARVHTPDAAGIAVDGTALRVDFGRAEAGAVAAVSRLQGRGPQGAAPCPGGAARAVAWEGLTLYMQGGAFVGWSRPDGSSAGLTCG